MAYFMARVASPGQMESATRAISSTVDISNLLMYLSYSY